MIMRHLAGFRGAVSGTRAGRAACGSMPTVDTSASPSAGALTRAARGLTEVFAPAVLATALPIVIGVHAGRTAPAGLAWGLLASVFSAIIPYAMIWYGVPRGRLSDQHIGGR